MVKKPLPLANPVLEMFLFGGYPKSNRFFGKFLKNLKFLQKFLEDLHYRALLPQNRDFFILKSTSCKNGPRFWKQMVKKPLPIARRLCGCNENLYSHPRAIQASAKISKPANGDFGQNTEGITLGFYCFF